MFFGGRRQGRRGHGLGEQCGLLGANIVIGGIAADFSEASRQVRRGRWVARRGWQVMEMDGIGQEAVFQL